MPKMKSKRGLTKRLHITGSGHIKTKTQGYNHLAQSKTRKQKRHARKANTLSRADSRRLKRLLAK